MNCHAFQFVTPQIEVAVDYYSAQMQISGNFSITQIFSPIKRLKYRLAAGCPQGLYGDLPQSVAEAKSNWQPFSDDALCNRFKLKSMTGIRGAFPSIERYQYMGSTPVTASNGYIFFIKPVQFWDGSDRTPTENWWSYDRLKPWDAQDPFYARNLSMYNAMADKTFDMLLLGGPNFITNGTIGVSFAQLVTFNQNATDGYGILSNGNMYINSMSFARGTDFPT
jgi:hypothetical protein